MLTIPSAGNPRGNLRMNFRLNMVFSRKTSEIDEVRPIMYGNPHFLGPPPEFLCAVLPYDAARVDEFERPIVILVLFICGDWRRNVRRDEKRKRK